MSETQLGCFLDVLINVQMVFQLSWSPQTQRPMLCTREKPGEGITDPQKVLASQHHVLHLQLHV